MCSRQPSPVFLRVTPRLALVDLHPLSPTVSLRVRSQPLHLTRPRSGISPRHPPDNTNEPYLNWLKAVSSKPMVPQTITTSYGEHEQTVPEDYATTVCDMFAQLGVRGSSVLFSSGDSGVGGGDCKANDGTSITRFQPMFPASCESYPPYMSRVI